MEDAGAPEQVPMNETEDWVSVHHSVEPETGSDVDGVPPGVASSRLQLTFSCTPAALPATRFLI